MNRLSDIRAAESMYDVIAGKPREIILDGEHSYAIDLTDGFTLKLVSNHPNPKLDDQGLTNWGRVRRVKIIAVEQQ